MEVHARGSKPRPDRAPSSHLDPKLAVDTIRPRNTTTTADTTATMGVPFEALLPYAIMTGVRLLDPLAALEGVNVMLQFFAFSAVSVGKLREMQNGGKRGRRGVDAWDRVSCRRYAAY